MLDWRFSQTETALTKVIDCSFGECAATTGLGLFSGLKFRFQVGWSAKKYRQSDIASVTEIEAEQFRSLGKAAAGAIIGGVLTGGIGLIAGAAIGGRKRKEASYLIRFKDGEYAAITETNGNVMKVLDHLAQTKKAKVREMVAADDPLRREPGRRIEPTF